MNYRLPSFVSLFLVMALLSAFAPAQVRPLAARAQGGFPTTPAASHEAAALASSSSPTSVHASPLLFIENAGQWDKGARFQMFSGSQGTVWLAEDAIWLTVLEPMESGETRSPHDPERAEPRAVAQPQQGAVMRLSFVGANPHPHIEPFNPLDTVVSYFLGNDPSQWRPDVPVWGGVRYVDLYPGIDLELTSEAGQMVQRLAARPDADLSAVQMRIEGAESVTLHGEALRLSSPAGDTIWPLPVANGSGGQARVEPRAALAFEVASPFGTVHSIEELVSEQEQSLDEDPADLLTSTFIGGQDYDQGSGISVDANGATYVTGSTWSLDFPTTPGAFDTSYNGNGDAFVVKLNAAGTDLIYATFLGGSTLPDHGMAITVGASGSAYVAGCANSSDFPTTPGAFDTSNDGGMDAFVVKLNAAGTGLAYATYLGGSEGDSGNGISIDSNEAAYITGETYSSDFPTTPGAFDTTYNGSSDFGNAYVVQLDPFGSGLNYATFLGGIYHDYGFAITTDPSGAAYVTGGTTSDDFPTTDGAFDTTYNGGDPDYGDAFVVKLSAAGSSLAYATFLGGSMPDWGGAIALDGSGVAYVTGGTASDDFPTTEGAFDTTYNGGEPYMGDAFVVKLSTAGSGLEYATFLGGSEKDSGFGVALGSGGAAYVTGSTCSLDFPTTPGAFDTSYNGDGDAFAVKLNAAGTDLFYATFLGGSGDDNAFDMHVDASGVAYVTGSTYSSDFPVTPGAFVPIGNGYWDGFAAKLAMGAEGGYSISGRVTGTDGQGVPDVTVSAGSGRWTVTDADGNYDITDLPLGTYTLTPYKSGYTFSPASRTVTVPPDATGQDFVGSSVSELVYDGPLFLPWGAVLNEIDNRISLGDHVHLRLPFRNNTAQTMYNMQVEFSGALPIMGRPGVHIYDGTDWTSNELITLTPSDIPPGQTAYADFWIYVDNVEPQFRESLSGQTLIKAYFRDAQWFIPILISPVSFDIAGNEDMTSGSCLHHPGNFEIERYAQYAAGAQSKSNPPTNDGDPDEPTQALRNLVAAVRTDFEGQDTGEFRLSDITLLARQRPQIIGDCSHFADLTTGLTRSLGLPARYIRSVFTRLEPPFVNSHAWVEAFLPDEPDGNEWRQADSSSGAVLQEWFYEDPSVGWTVYVAWADLYPLSTACHLSLSTCLCVHSCYEAPVDCPDCLFWNALSPTPLDTSCVEDVTGDYHNVNQPGIEELPQSDDALVVQAEANVFATRGVPFSVSASIRNDTTATLNGITASVSLSDTAFSAAQLFDPDPPYHVLPALAPGETANVTWEVTPLATGSGFPLRVFALSESLLGFDELPLVVGEPGSLPPLTVGGTCNSDQVNPGQSLTLTGYVLDELLQPLDNPAAEASASVFFSPTTEFSETIAMTYDSALQQYRGTVDLPVDAPAGRYDVDVHATCPGYSSANSESAFWVAPPLEVGVDLSSDIIRPDETLTVTVAVQDRGEPISTAGVWADFTLPGSAVRIPLLPAGEGEYAVAFRPADVSSELGGAFAIEATADYKGSSESAATSVLVLREIYLPLILRNH